MRAGPDPEPPIVVVRHHASLPRRSWNPVYQPLKWPNNASSPCAAIALPARSWWKPR
jgi:hypothetical protein